MLKNSQSNCGMAILSVESKTATRDAQRKIRLDRVKRASRSRLHALADTSRTQQRLEHLHRSRGADGRFVG